MGRIASVARSGSKAEIQSVVDLVNAQKIDLGETQRIVAEAAAADRLVLAYTNLQCEEINDQMLATLKAQGRPWCRIWASHQATVNSTEQLNGNEELKKTLLSQCSPRYSKGKNKNTDFYTMKARCLLRLLLFSRTQVPGRHASSARADNRALGATTSTSASGPAFGTRTTSAR